MPSPNVFTGKTVADLVDAHIDLLNLYKQGQIRHNELIDWLNEDR